MPTPNDYSRLILGGSPKQGEYGQVQPSDTLHEPGDDMVPNPVPSKQFSEGRSGDPKTLLENARQGVNDHADLIHDYGYTMPVATLGQHPWLRDSLAVPTEREPGAAQPNPEFAIPTKRGL